LRGGRGNNLYNGFERGQNREETHLVVYVTVKDKPGRKMQQKTKKNQLGAKRMKIYMQLYVEKKVNGG